MASASNKSLSRFSIGVGDRFGAEAGAQLRACQIALDNGVEVIPVWNKSNREHVIVGSDPSQTRDAAERAISSAHWSRPYFVDADHITLATVDRFLPSCDFFTIDVAESIGKPVEADHIEAFVRAHPELTGTLEVEGLQKSLTTDRDFAIGTANKFLRQFRKPGKRIAISKRARATATSFRRCRWTRRIPPSSRLNC